MELEKNTKRFLSKLAHFYQISDERAFNILLEPVHGKQCAELNQGKIVSLNTRAIPWAVSQILRREENIDFPVNILNLDEVDISDLHDLISLDFVSNEKTGPQAKTFSFEDFPALEHLTFSRHNVKALNLTKNKHLKELDCSMNELTELDLSQNPELEKLNCQMNKISTLDLSGNYKLNHLNIRYIPVNETQIHFPQKNSIVELYIDETEIKSIDLQHFKNLQKVKVGDKIQSLDVTPCKHLHALSLIKTHLDTLDISECQNLVEFSVREGKIKELTCNEFQLFIIPGFSKKLKITPSPAQKEVINTYVLHNKAISYNWDEGLSKLKKILKDKNCDKATASLIYWLGRPNYFLRYKKVSEVPEHSKELFRFLNALEKQLLNGSFHVNMISFNPKNYLNTDWTTDSFDPLSAQRTIDEKLKAEISGKDPGLFDYNRKLKIQYM